jgi:hypothetical protein
MKYPHDVDAPSDEQPVVRASSGRAMRFSSPMPWILAIVLSVAIWALIGWSVWRFTHG